MLIPLAIGIAAGRPGYGSFAALGALNAGLVSFRGVTRTRVLAVAAVAAGTAISTFAGATAAHAQPWLLVPVVMIWAYLTGLFAALGPTAMAIALQWPVALLIASAIPLGPGPAAIRALLVLAGGLWQGALVVSSWALRRGSAERAGLAAAYLALSQYAAQLAAGGPAAPTVTELLVRAASLPHGYWAVLTVFIVSRPDYRSTLQRGVQRAAGTVVGAGLGVATALLARAGTPALLTGLGVSLVAAYAVFTVNFLLFGVFLTDFVVVLLALLGLPADSTALARLAGATIGAALALTGYVAWPTWEGSSANEKFARLLQAKGRYAAAQLRAYSRPRSAEAANLRSLQLASRRARSDAEASADRLADEPPRPPMTADLAQALTAAVHRMTLGELTLYAALTLEHKRILAGRKRPGRHDRRDPAGSPGPSGPPGAARPARCRRAAGECRAQPPTALAGPASRRTGRHGWTSGSVSACP